ncbi:hypothetical protein O7608_27770 [Solwaraspora sp. WMMA2056]|uniref:hypothetical protein n=1 Tax=Solwaraspora sp. WMMA2056 TaxID=3015161 RepID=UPI00259B776F|nr:hypothetical protein [Solwaraspora sp. WMMA2056]WJK40173.1 hypothetical protein O7608_27770 [Solwaraspora sp. WMMA2056]
MSPDTEDTFTGPPPPGTDGTDVTAPPPESDRIESDRIESRAGHLLPEEESAGSDDPVGQAAAILHDSDRREEPPG